MTTTTTQTTAQRMLSRKFLLALAVLVSATWLVASHHIADGVYSAVIIATAAAYITGNVAQKYVQNSTATAASTPATTPASTMTLTPLPQVTTR